MADGAVENTVTILLLGDDGVGKSTFLARISRGGGTLEGPATAPKLRDLDQPFVFELSSSRRGRYRFEFHDVDGPENWRLLRPDLVLLCYAIGQRSSLDSMQNLWIREIHRTFQASDRLPIIVVGLQRDRRSESDPDPRGPIYPQEAYRVAQEMRVDKYVECSAVTGELLKLAFEEICQTAAMTATAKGGQSEGGCAVM